MDTLTEMVRIFFENGVHMPEGSEYRIGSGRVVSWDCRSRIADGYRWAMTFHGRAAPGPGQLWT